MKELQINNSQKLNFCFIGTLSNFVKRRMFHSSHTSLQTCMLYLCYKMCNEAQAVVNLFLSMYKSRFLYLFSGIYYIRNNIQNVNIWVFLRHFIVILVLIYSTVSKPHGLSSLTELHGIQKQSDIGFLTILESMRYCEVRMCIAYKFSVQAHRRASMWKIICVMKAETLVLQ